MDNTLRLFFWGAWMKSRLARIAATLALALLLIGCAPIDSIFPLYKADEAVFDDRVLGSWQPVITDANASDKDQRWTFSHSEGHKHYDFKWSAVGAKGGFVAKMRFVRLGDSLFIDFEGDTDKLDDDPPRTGSVVPFPMVPTHMIGRVWLERDTLQIRFLHDDWVKKQIDRGTFSLAHLDVGINQILAAPTDDLRKFMQAHADDTEALSSNFQFVRAK